MGNTPPPAKADEGKSKATTSASVMVKYMGSADVAILESDETFDGRYPDGLGKRFEFSKENNFVLDFAGVPSEAVELLLEDGDRFRNVSDLRRVPSNLNQKMFGGHHASTPAEDVLPPPAEA